MNEFLIPAIWIAAFVIGYLYGNKRGKANCAERLAGNNKQMLKFQLQVNGLKTRRDQLSSKIDDLELQLERSEVESKQNNTEDTETITQLQHRLSEIQRICSE